MVQASREPGLRNIKQCLETEFCKHELSFGEKFSREGIEELLFNMLASESEIAIIGGAKV